MGQKWRVILAMHAQIKIASSSRAPKNRRRFDKPTPPSGMAFTNPIRISEGSHLDMEPAGQNPIAGKRSAMQICRGLHSIWSVRTGTSQCLRQSVQRLPIGSAAPNRVRAPNGQRRGRSSLLGRCPIFARSKNVTYVFVVFYDHRACFAVMTE